MRRRDGAPVWLVENEPAVVLKRADLNGRSDEASYSEAWLQNLLHENPSVFPIEQIEPGFGDLVALCRELPLALGSNLTGYLDNFFVTPSGGLVLVEVKLWRNPEARRAAVAQAMEYAAAIFRMGYGDLETAVAKARSATGESPKSIFELVSSQYPAADQAEFYDAVSRNLARGRAIIVVLGDGIREEVQSLAAILQGHAGHRFTFALVEMAVYRISPTQSVVVPSVLAETVLIERGVVRVEGDNRQGLKVEIAAVPVSTPSARRVSIGEDEFFELLGRRYSAMPDALRSLLAKAELLGVSPVFQGGLNLKHAASEGQQPLNMGTITRDGFVDSGPSTWFGRGPIGQIYCATLADAIGGQVKVTNPQTQEAGIRAAAGGLVRLPDLLPQHEQLWLEAMARYIADNGMAPETAEHSSSSNAVAALSA
jgi:hypothetical protein